MGTCRRRRTAERGASAVEFAILIPFVLLVMFEIISWAYMFSFRQALSQAASEGARAGVGGYTSSTSCPVSGTWNVAACAPGTAAATAVNNDLGSYSYNGTTLKCGSAGVTCTIQQSATCPSGHTCLQVTVAYPYRSQPLLSGMPSKVWPFSVVLPPNLTFTSVVGVS